MSIAEDASTPAAAHSTAGTASASSPSFSPPAGALVAVKVNILYFNPTTGTSLTVSDSLGSAYAALGSPADGGSGAAVYSAQFWCYYASAPGSITVTATNAGAAGSAGGSMQVVARVLTGAAAAQGAAAGAASAASGAGLQVSITPTTAGSWVEVAAAGASTTLWSPDSSTTEEDTWSDGNSGDAGFTGHDSAPSAGSAVTVGWGFTGTGAVCTAAEVLPGAGATAVTGADSLAGTDAAGTLSAALSGGSERALFSDGGESYYQAGPIEPDADTFTGTDAEVSVGQPTSDSDAWAGTDGGESVSTVAALYLTDTDTARSWENLTQSSGGQQSETAAGTDGGENVVP